ncbi:hypothetical protein Tco_1263106 [Tanacetum coccineum]
MARKGKNVEDEPQEPVAAGRWLPVEEELLATCYVAVSEDNNVGRSQKHDTFWYRFNAAYKRAKRLGKSGENDVDYLKRAQSIYRDEHRGVAFSHPKWDAPEQVDLTGDVPGASQEDLFGHNARPTYRPGKTRPAKKANPTQRRAPVEVARRAFRGLELMEQEFVRNGSRRKGFEAQAKKAKYSH